MDILKDRYTITELSEYLNVTDHTLRFYEKEFNLSVPKDSRGRRYYTTEFANLMFQIKSMRDQGLEIKAIRKILQDGNIINEPYPVEESNNSSLIPYNSKENNMEEIKSFFLEFKDEIACSMHAEISIAQDYISKEINKSKLELGACFENNIRKIEAKMEKHFQDIDLSLGKWREKNRTGFVRRILNKAFK